MKTFFSILTLCWFAVLSGFSDTLIFRGGQTVDGTIIQTNDGQYLVLADLGTYTFAQTSIKEVRQDGEAPAERSNGSRLPNFRTTVLSLSRQEWSAHLSQIPATVIDNGVFKNVPYVSFHCGDDYEVNIYGDLKAPAAIEVGVYRKLLGDEAARRNCVKFITDLLVQTADRDCVQSLNLQKDLKVRAGLSFEITPPDAEDAYMGWWISVYSEENLNLSRASPKEMANISVPKTSTAASEDGAAWSADDMKLARSQPETITFINSSGDAISNAVVVRVIDNAYIIWRQGVGGGKVALADLPASVRARFGYDEARAHEVYASDERKKKAQAQVLAAQVAQAQAQTASSVSQPDPSYYGNYGGFGGNSSSGYVPSHGGSVYVKGYTRKDGTYVHAHTRRK